MKPLPDTWIDIAGVECCACDNVFAVHEKGVQGCNYARK